LEGTSVGHPVQPPAEALNFTVAVCFKEKTGPFLDFVK